MKRYTKDMNNGGTMEHTIYNQAGNKVGVAVWTGVYDNDGIAVQWECYNLSDHLVAVARTVMAARDILNGFS